MKISGVDAFKLWLFVRSGTRYSFRRREFEEILEKYNLSEEDVEKIVEKLEEVIDRPDL
ncbi:MAG: hypothetical protein ACXQS2_00375 [Methermicoccaceae archaeon]